MVKPSLVSDANNTLTPTANAQNGLIPSYTVTDLTASYKFSKSLNLKAGLNNLFDERYFTRRAGGYPGPGALPGDGRTFFVFAQIRDKLAPLERGTIYEDPLHRVLKKAHLGENTDGGSTLNKNGSVGRVGADIK